jgi:uncharacterized protein
MKFLHALACLLALAGALPAGAEERVIVIGTGGLAGVYFPVGGAICRTVNQGRKDHGIRCTVESTAGSVANLNALAAGELDLALAQSDSQYQAATGIEGFRDRGPDSTLRALFSLYPEPFTLVARADAKIKSLDDLKGKRFNIGDPGSGTRVVTELLLKELGWPRSTFRPAAELRPGDMLAALCERKLDAFTYVVGHPNAAIREATANCGAGLVDVSGPAVQKLLAEHPYFTAVLIPAKLYRGNDVDIRSFGPRATVVTSTRLPEPAAYAIVKAVFENLGELKKQHPALDGLTPEQMLSGNTAPFHDGALRYYKEKGLVP